MSSDVFVGLVVLDVHVFNVLDVQDVCDDHNVFVVLDVHVGSFGTLWNLEGLLNEDILSSFEKLVYRHGASYLTVQYRHGASYLTVLYRHIITTLLFSIKNDFFCRKSFGEKKILGKKELLVKKNFQ